MVKKSREVLREKLRSKNTFFKSTNIRHVRPMFSVSWCAMLAAFSYMLESTDDPKVCVCVCVLRMIERERESWSWFKYSKSFISKKMS